MRAITPTTTEQNLILALSRQLPGISAEADNILADVQESVFSMIEEGWFYNRSFFESEPTWRDYAYMIILDSVQEYQVLRYIHVDYSFCNNHGFYCREHTEEVAQRWIAPDGKVTLLASDLWDKKGQYWRYNQPLRLRKEDAVEYDFRIYAGYVQSLTTSFRNQHDLQEKYLNESSAYDDTLEFVRFSLSPYGEWMNKLQPALYKLCRDYTYIYSRAMRYEREIRLATRYHYDISNKDVFYLWTDYLKYLHDNDEYIKNGNICNHNRFLQPQYVCPQDLKQAHDKWMAIDKRNRERKAELAKRKKAEESLAQFLKHHKHFTDIYFNNGHLYAYSLNSPVEYWNEGDAMHHCVGKYWNDADSLILSIRDQQGNRIATAEVSISDLDIVQIGGVDNLGNQIGGKDYGILPEWNEIYDLILANMYRIRERKDNRQAERKQKKIA